MNERFRTHVALSSKTDKNCTSSCSKSTKPRRSFASSLTISQSASWVQWPIFWKTGSLLKLLITLVRHRSLLRGMWCFTIVYINLTFCPTATILSLRIFSLSFRESFFWNAEIIEGCLLLSLFRNSLTASLPTDRICTLESKCLRRPPFLFVRDGFPIKRILEVSKYNQKKTKMYL
jgi:hypothetical protein